MQHQKCTWRKASDKEQSCRVSFMCCMGSLVCWVLHRAAWQGLNKTQSSKRMTGSGPCRPTHPGSPFVAWLLIEKAQQVASGRRGGWSPTSPPEQQSSCPVPRSCAVALPKARTSCSVSGKQQDHSLHVWCQSNSSEDVSVGEKPCSETIWLNVYLAHCTFESTVEFWREPHCRIVTDWRRFEHF